MSFTAPNPADNPDGTYPDPVTGLLPVPVRVGITCAEAQVLHIPAVLHLPPELAAGLEDAVRTGRADDWDYDDLHPAMAWLLDWLEEHREAWENQLDYGLHCQDGEDLEIRNVEVE